MAKIITDTQLGLLTDSILEKIRKHRDKPIPAVSAPHFKEVIKNLTRSAKEYNHCVAKLEKLSMELHSKGYGQPNGSCLWTPNPIYESMMNEMAELQKNADNAYGRYKAGAKSDIDYRKLREEIRRRVLRASLRKGDLDKELTAIENEYIK